MRRFAIWLFLLIVLGALVACRFSFNLSSGSQEEIPTPALVLTTPANTGGSPGGNGPTTAPPTPVPASPTPAGTQVSCPGKPFQLRIPQGLSLNLQCFQTTFGMMDSPQVITIWRFATSPSDTFCEKGCVDIIPVADAKQKLGGFAFPPEGQNAAVLYETLRQNLTFASGQGVRTLELQGQGVVLVSNGNLTYVFRGYSTNGQYAVYATFPVQAPGLPNAETPDANTNPQVFAPLPPADDPAQWDAYNQKAMQYLAGLSAQQFTPNLALLDALIQSVATGP